MVSDRRRSEWIKIIIRLLAFTRYTYFERPQWSSGLHLHVHRSSQNDAAQQVTTNYSVL